MNMKGIGMSNNKARAAAGKAPELQTPKPAARSTPLEVMTRPGPAMTTCIPVALRRDHKVGEEYWKAGRVIGEVHLPEGISLNYFVDAVRNGLAGEVDPQPSPDR